MNSYASTFDVEKHLNQPPRIWDAPEYTWPGSRGIFYEGAPYQGHETRCFAWLGIPQGASAQNKVPGIVLIHGGGGTAHADWVKIWVDRGYAAIAMDTCGSVPGWSSSGHYHPTNWPRHKYSGAPGWGNYELVDDPLADQWVYQATAAVLRGTALLRSLPEVDAANVGIAGISWGGFLTIIATSIAPQETYRYAIPVYAAAGFNRLPTNCIISRPQVTREMIDKWDKYWDPLQALNNITTPMLFLTDAEDIGFSLPTWQDTTERVAGPVQRSMRVEYPHDHQQSMPSVTEKVFAESVMAGKQLPVWGTIKQDRYKLSCPFSYPDHYAIETTLLITRSSGLWADRRWRPIQATLKDGVLTADAIYGVTAAFFHVKDEQGCRWSSPVLMDFKEPRDLWNPRG